MNSFSQLLQGAMSGMECVSCASTKEPVSAMENLGPSRQGRTCVRPWPRLLS